MLRATPRLSSYIVKMMVGPSSAIIHRPVSPNRLKPQCHPSFRLIFACNEFGPLIRRTIVRRGGIAMAFFKRELFKRELGPIERFENALKEKLAARQKLAERLSVAEAELAEKRTAAERLAVAGAANARLDRAEAAMRAVEDRTKTMRAELLECDEQVASAERALADAKTSATATRWLTRSKRWLRPSSGLRRDLIPAPRTGRGRHQERDVDTGSDQVFEQRRCRAPRSSSGGGFDMLGAAIRGRAPARAMPTSPASRYRSRSNRHRRRSSGS